MPTFRKDWMNAMHARQPTLVVFFAVAVAVAGCNTAPVVRWDGGDPASAGGSMPKAMRYLDAARIKYRDAVATQMHNERNLTNVLVGAGALVAALAVGKVHRDALVGVSFLAGTGYTLGNVNLQRPRVLIYQAGVEALNCAERAVTPFAIDEEELQGLLKALDALDGARRNLSFRIAVGQSARSRALPTSLSATEFDALVPVVQQAMQGSDTTLRAGREFAAAAKLGARQLVAAVNGIDAAVVRSVINETPDLSSVPKVISGLAGMIGSFAPGAGIEALVEQRLGAVPKNMTGVSGTKDEIQIANEAIRTAASDVAARHAEAAGRLAGRTAAWPDDAFKDCGVAQVVSALSASQTSLQFVAKASSRRLIDIAGGVKPYFVELDGPTIDGLTLKAPVRFDARAEISIDGAKVQQPVETVLRITDSSPTARTLSVPLSVTAAASASTPAAAASSVPSPQPAASTDTIAADVEKLGLTTKFSVDSKQFVVTGRPRQVGDTIEVVVTCPPGNTDTFARAKLAAALLAAAKIIEPPQRKVVVTTNPVSCAPQ